MRAGSPGPTRLRGPTRPAPASGGLSPGGAGRGGQHSFARSAAAEGYTRRGAGSPGRGGACGGGARRVSSRGRPRLVQSRVPPARVPGLLSVPGRRRRPCRFRSPPVVTAAAMSKEPRSGRGEILECQVMWEPDSKKNTLMDRFRAAVSAACGLALGECACGPGLPGHLPRSEGPPGGGGPAPGAGTRPFPGRFWQGLSPSRWNGLPLSVSLFRGSEEPLDLGHL